MKFVFDNYIIHPVKMIFLILTIVCSTSIALILKFSDTKKGSPILLLSANYFVASLITLLFLIFGDEITFSWHSFIFGALLGVMFVFSFFAFTKAVSSSGASLSSVSSRLSVVIPILLSIIFYNEIPNRFQFVGFIFAVITIILFYFSIRRFNEGSLRFTDYFYLFALLAGIGINDFSMKIFQQWRPGNEKPVFLFSIFTFAFIYTAAIVFIKKIPLNNRTILTGFALGVPNIFSSFFLLSALASLPAIIVYPVVNIGVILFTTLGAVIFWKEKIGFFGKLALLSGTIAIFLLSIK